MTTELRILMCCLGLMVLAPVTWWAFWPLPRITKSRPPTFAESGIACQFARHAAYVQQQRTFHQPKKRRR